MDFFPHQRLKAAVVLTAIIMLGGAIIDVFFNTNWIHAIVSSDVMFFGLFLVAFVMAPLLTRYIDNE
ncbi:MAG TPA: hypothetical protein VK946_05980 [Methylotenera sp.]|nr:hypothetical protein [Methylotenera sp.]